MDPSNNPTSFDIRPCPMGWLESMPLPPSFIFVLLGLIYLLLIGLSLAAFVQSARGRTPSFTFNRIWIGSALALTGIWLVSGTLFWSAEDCGETRVFSTWDMWRYQSPGAYFALIGTIVGITSLLNRRFIGNAFLMRTGVLLIALSQWTFSDYQNFGIANTGSLSLILLVPFFFAVIMPQEPTLNPQVEPGDNN